MAAMRWQGLRLPHFAKRPVDPLIRSSTISRHLWSWLVADIVLPTRGGSQDAGSRYNGSEERGQKWLNYHRNNKSVECSVVTGYRKPSMSLPSWVWPISSKMRRGQRQI